MLSNNLSDKLKAPSRLEISLLQTAKFEGRQEGREEGKHEKAIEMAKNLKLLGLLTNNQIAQVTGLSLSEIENLSI
ncbi:MAG: hypothetical protein U0Y10_10380 [Spirosomataceae bacterium]